MDRDELKTRAAELDRLRRSIFGRCRELGFGDEERREVQLRATGKESLTSMTADEMRAVVRALGAGTPDRSGLPRNAHAGKLRALWISAFWLGVVRERSDQALGAWVCRQSGLAAANRARARIVATTRSRTIAMASRCWIRSVLSPTNALVAPRCRTGRAAGAASAKRWMCAITSCRKRRS